VYNSLKDDQLSHTAQVLLGVALHRNIFQQQRQIRPSQFLPHESHPGRFDPEALKEVLLLLQEGLEGPLHQTFKGWIKEGKTVLGDTYSILGDQNRALSTYEEIQPLPSAPASVRVTHLSRLAALELARKNHEKAAKLADEVLAILETETNTSAKADGLLRVTHLLLTMERDEQVELAFLKAVSLLRDSEEGRAGLLTYLNQHILPTLENLNLSKVGAKILETVLHIPEIEEDSEVSLPLYASLASFYAKSYLNTQPMAGVIDKAGKAHFQHPNWQVIQKIQLSAAEIEKVWRPDNAARFYRNAIISGLGEYKLSGDWGLFFHALRRAMKLAFEMGRYQDVVDFGLIGTSYLNWKLHDHEESPEEREAAMEFLIEGGKTLTETARFDLALESYALAIGRLPNSGPHWGRQVWVGASNFYEWVGDYEAARESLFKANDSPYPPPDVVHTFFHALSEQSLQFGEVFMSLGNYLAAEEMFQECIQSANSFIRRPDVEAECHWRLSIIYWHFTREFQKSAQEHNKALKILVANEDFIRLDEIVAVANQRTIQLGGQSQLTGAEIAETYLEGLSRYPDTPRVLTIRALLLSQLLFTRKQSLDTPLDLDPLRVALRDLLAKPFLSTREYQSLLTIVANLRGMGAQELAKDILEETLGRLEYVRGHLDSPNLTIRLGGVIDQVFQTMSNIYLQQGCQECVNKALEIREANRGRTFLKIRNRGVFVKRGQPLEGNVYEQARTTLEQLRTRPEGRSFSSEIGAANVFLYLKLGLKDGKQGWGDIHSKPTIIPQRQSIPRLDIGKLQESLSPTSAVIVYHLTEEIAGAWVIDHENILWKSLGSLNKVEHAILRFRTELLSSEKVWEGRFKKAATAAYDALIAPLTSLIGEKTHLVFIPDKTAFVIPFEPLVITDGPQAGKFLIEKYQVSYHLSLKMLKPRQPVNGTHSSRTPHLLLIGNPAFGEKDGPAMSGQTRDALVALPGTQEELARIKEVVGLEHTLAYSGERARKEVLKQNIPL